MYVYLICVCTCTCTCICICTCIHTCMYIHSVPDPQATKKRLADARRFISELERSLQGSEESAQEPLPGGRPDFQKHI